MWMPDDSDPATGAGAGSQEVAGIVDRFPQHQVEPPGLLGGRSRETVLFRLDTGAGRVLNCRFEGSLSGMMDQGDRVRVTGAMVGGVLEVSRIVDDAGAVIAQSRCFVATVVFGDPMAPEVVRLRCFRDQVLRRSAVGRMAIRLYWRLGPMLAGKLAGHPRLCRATRLLVLSPLCRLLSSCEAPQVADAAGLPRGSPKGDNVSNVSVKG